MNGDYTVAIWATIGLTVLFTVPVMWQFLQPNDDDFGAVSYTHLTLPTKRIV